MPRTGETPVLLCCTGKSFVCLDEAVRQARRFHTTWQSELVRYVVHGVLHLLGYDDQRRPGAPEDEDQPKTLWFAAWPVSLPSAPSAKPE